MTRTAEHDLAGFCRTHRARLAFLFDSLDPGFACGELADGCVALLDHFRQRDDARLHRLIARGHRILAVTRDVRSPLVAELFDPPPERPADPPPAADLLLADRLVFQGLEGPVARREDGGVDWYDRGPARDIEWAFTLNRHRYLCDALVGHRLTGRAGYLAVVDRWLADWCAANPMFPTPAAKTHDPVWRELEVGLRCGQSWPTLWCYLQPHAGFRPTTRLLMLCAIAEQAPYLERFHMKKAHNHTAMEVAGLAMCAVCFPELRRAREWLDHASAVMAAQPDGQVYPDGVQMEQAYHYHNVTLANFAFAEAILECADPALVPDDLHGCCARMRAYTIEALRPNGTGPMNNDSDLVDLRGPARAIAEEAGRDDWLHVVTAGAEGIPPADPPSRWYPWAGQLVSRDGWDADARWSFFDVGALGVSGHQHRDTLHLSVRAGGRDLLVDGGRYTYRPDVWRQYYLGTASHNCVLVDGAGHRDGPEVADAPHPLPASVEDACDYVVGRHEDGFLAKKGRTVHTRAVLFLRGHGWLVVDRVESDREHVLTPLWHFHPSCTVRADGDDLITDDPDTGNLRLHPIAQFAWRYDLVRGEEDADPGTYRMWKADLVRAPDDEQVQGWYSPTYNVQEPATCAVYRSAWIADATFAWLIAAGRGPAPAAGADATCEAGRFAGTIRLGDGRWRVGIDLGASGRPSLDRT